MTEQEVRRYLRQMKEEDSERAFKGFYDLTYDRLFRIAYYYVRDEDAAQEIVLDVFMRLWQMRDRLPEVNSIEDYCFILTKNASLNYLERENRQSPLPAEHLPEPADTASSPEETLISEELFARYVKALDRLPQRCREERQSYAQVAEALGISVKTVDAQLQKATARLRKMLLPDEGDE